MVGVFKRLSDDPAQTHSKHVADLFGYSVSEATIFAARERCADNLERFMEVTGERLGNAAVLHADETGMRVENKTVWLHSLSNAESDFLIPCLVPPVILWP